MIRTLRMNALCAPLLLGILAACGPVEEQGVDSGAAPVAAVREIEIVSPAQDETWRPGEGVVVRWKAHPDFGTAFVAELVPQAGDPIQLGGAYLQELDKPGQQEFFLPDTFAGASGLKLRLTSTWARDHADQYDVPIFGESKGTITVDDSRVVGSVVLVEPKTPQTWTIGSQQLVTWKTDSRAGTSVKIALYKDGEKVTDLADGYAEIGSGPTSQSITVPEVPPGEGYKVRVLSTWTLQNPDKYPEPVFDESPASITIN